MRSLDYSRRVFLAAAGTATAALGAGNTPKIKAGVVGLGGRGAWLSRLVGQHGGYEITAVADYFPDRAVEKGHELGVPQARCFSGLSGYQKVIDSGVEAVFLETPPCFFPEHVRAAVDAGCHVYVAKPVGCDVPGTLSVQASGEKASNNKQVFLVDFQTRTDPLIIGGVARLHSGAIGKLGLISSYYADHGFRDPPKTATIESRLTDLIWTNDVALGGGMLVNAGIHMLDLGLWMNGDRAPSSATGAAETIKANPHGDTADVYSITYEFDNGVVMNHRGDHLDNRTGFTTDCSAFCQAGHLQAGYGGRVRMLGNSAGWRGGEVEDLYPNGAKRNIALFHQCIVEGRHDNPTLAPSINATLAAILGREAGRRKTKLTMNDLIKENRVREIDLSGLRE